MRMRNMMMKMALSVMVMVLMLAFSSSSVNAQHDIFNNPYTIMTIASPEAMTPNQKFGYSISLDRAGNWLAVGAPGASEGGKVWVYNVGANDYSTAHPVMLPADKIGQASNFGQAVAVENDILWVTSDLSGGSQAVWIFRYNGPNWTPVPASDGFNVSGCNETFPPSIALTLDNYGILRTCNASDMNNSFSARTVTPEMGGEALGKFNQYTYNAACKLAVHEKTAFASSENMVLYWDLDLPFVEPQITGIFFGGANSSYNSAYFNGRNCNPFDVDSSSGYIVGLINTTTYVIRQNVSALTDEYISVSNMSGITGTALSYPYWLVGSSHGSLSMQVYNLSSPASPVWTAAPGALEYACNGSINCRINVEVHDQNRLYVSVVSPNGPSSPDDASNGLVYVINPLSSATTSSSSSSSPPTTTATTGAVTSPSSSTTSTTSTTSSASTSTSTTGTPDFTQLCASNIQQSLRGNATCDPTNGEWTVDGDASTSGSIVIATRDSVKVRGKLTLTRETSLSVYWEEGRGTAYMDVESAQLDGNLTVILTQQPPSSLEVAVVSRSSQTFNQRQSPPITGSFSEIVLERSYTPSKCEKSTAKPTYSGASVLLALDTTTKCGKNNKNTIIIAVVCSVGGIIVLSVIILIVLVFLKNRGKAASFFTTQSNEGLRDNL